MDLDDTNLEILVPYSSNILSHDQTQVATCAAASSVFQDESRGLNELSPQDLNCLKSQVYEYAVNDRWKEAETIFNKYADMVRIPLNDNGDIAHHVAVKENSITFVKGLVNLMTPQDLQILNSDRYTAFCMAAESGYGGFIQIMIEKNENLPLIKAAYGILPVHRAASRGHHKIVQDLSSKTLLQKMDSEDIERLIFESIESDMFDVAMKVFEEYPAVLAIARSRRNDIFKEYPADLAIVMYRRNDILKEADLDIPAFRMLACKPLEDMKGSKNRGTSSGDGLQLLKKIWHQHRRQLKSEEISELMSEPTFLLFIALKAGNVEAVKWLIFMNPELLNILDSYGRSILHYAVQRRHSSIVSYVFKMGPPNHVVRVIDREGNNILHFAACPLENEETSSSLRATTKMRREVAWFKEIEKNIPSELRTMRNVEGMTPQEIFIDKHKVLSEEVKDAAKGIADSGMLVAALVATVAFAAALVVPGDKTNPWFIVFILANAAALFTSSASILSFLSNFTTSRFANSEFVIALHPSLILGPMLLLISIVTMVISFAAASFLIFEHTSKWVAYVVTSMGVFPILLFFLFHFSIFDTFIWSRFYRLS